MKHPRRRRPSPSQTPSARIGIDRARTARRAALIFALGLLSPVLAAASPTPSEKAAAQALFDDALKLIESRRFEEARGKLEESERLDPAIGTRYQLAQCYEALGRTASAWAAFVEVADLAHAAGQSARESAAQGRARSLEPKVDRLVIDVSSPDVAGLEVRRDGLIIGPAQWGLPIPVDPGAHHLTASSPTTVPWSTDVNVSGAGETVRVRIPPPTPAIPLVPTTPPLVALPGPAPASAQTENAPGAKPRTATTQRTVGIVTAGVGLGGLAAGTAMGLLARSNYDGAGANCQPAGCNSVGKGITDRARSLGNAATGVFVAGGALLVGGGVLWLTAPHAHTKEGISSVLELGVGVGFGVLDVRGRF
jgi:hypothetical protein